MQLNRIQHNIFATLAKEKKVGVEEYICTYSEQFLGVRKEKMEDLTEPEGDKWINTAYLQSLEEGK